MRPDRNQRADDARHQRAEMDVAGEHDMAGTHPGGRRDDALAHAFDVDRQRRRVLEQARARRLRRLRQPERIVERMDVKGARPMQGVEVVVALEHLAHALGRPALDVGAELLAVELQVGQNLVAVVDLGHLEPAGHRGDARHARLGDGAAHIFDAHLGQRPQRLGVIHPDPADDLVHGFGEAGQDEPVIASGRVPGDALRSPAPPPTSRGARSRARW